MRPTLIAGSRLCTSGSIEGRTGRSHHDGATFRNRMAVSARLRSPPLRTRSSRGAERDLRGGLPRVLVRIPTRAWPARRAGCTRGRRHPHQGELHTGRRYSVVLGTHCIIPPGSCGWIEEPRLLGYHLDAESFLLAAHDMDRL